MANPANGAASPLTVDGLTNNQTYFARVRARNATGWGPWSELSLPFTPKAAPVLVTQPRISTDGTPSVGETISCDDGTWSPAPSDLNRQWRRGTTKIGSDESTYTLVAADAGQAITCVVTALNDQGVATSATSNTITPLGQAPVNTTAPTISTDGTPAVGETVSVTTGLWSGTTPITYSYQWRRAPGVDIGTGLSSYTITADDAGVNVWCLVTATNSVGSATAGTSNVIVPASQSGGGGGTAVPLFDGTQLSAWYLIQVSNPPNLQSSNHPAPGGTDVVQLANDPLGIVPGPVIDCRANDVDHVGDRTRSQAVTNTVIPIDGSQTIWFRRCIGIPPGFPLVQGPPNGNYADCSTGTYNGEPYAGTSAFPNGLRNWQAGGAAPSNHFCSGRTASWNTPVWHVPATAGWHKIFHRVHISTTSSGWVEIYYAKWGQPLQIQQLTVADTGGTLVNGGTRINCVTVSSGNDESGQKMTITQYRNYPQASFVAAGLTHIYFYKCGYFDDADVSSVNDIDPE